MQLQKTSTGQTNLHIWRGGRSYEKQKGTIYRGEWNNIVFTGSPALSANGSTIQYDIRDSLPCPNQAFDAVFLFHIVEHLTPGEAQTLLREVSRVLKPCGIVRLSTPNLEDMCRAYLKRLEEYDRNRSDSNLIKYEWSVLEILDQIARVRTGGLMAEYVRNQRYDPEYALERYGDVFKDFYRKEADVSTKRRATTIRMSAFFPDKVLRAVLRRIRRALDITLLGCDWEAFQGFRRSGEVNKWLYDYFSLSMLLRNTGFCGISRKTYRTSDIPDWDRFDLEKSVHGDYAIEPSLYVEARKPSDVVSSSNR